MSFTRLLTHEVTVKRPQATVGVQKAYTQVAANLACLIQPLDNVANQIVGMAFGEGFRCFADLTAGILDGDELVDQDGAVYFVRGIKKFNYGSFPHLEVLLMKDKRP